MDILCHFCFFVKVFFVFTLYILTRRVNTLASPRSLLGGLRFSNFDCLSLDPWRGVSMKSCLSVRQSVCNWRLGGHEIFALIFALKLSDFLWTKIYSSSHIAGFFNHQYLWKWCINIFDFLHGNILQGKVTFESATFNWVCPGMSKLAYIYQWSLGVVLVIFVGKE